MQGWPTCCNRLKLVIIVLVIYFCIKDAETPVHQDIRKLGGRAGSVLLRGSLKISASLKCLAMHQEFCKCQQRYGLSCPKLGRLTPSPSLQPPQPLPLPWSLKWATVWRHTVTEAPLLIAVVVCGRGAPFP